MKRRTFITTTAGIATASTIGLAGCIGKASGTLATRVSDQPGDISDFKKCVVTISEIWVKPENKELQKKDIEATKADLVKLQGEKSALVDTVELPTGSYEFLQLKISQTTGVLDDGTEAEVTVPGDAPLKFNKSFEIREGKTTTFTADFTPVKRGQTGKYVLQPVSNEVTVTYEGEGTPQNGTATNTTSTSTSTSTPSS